MTKKVKDIVKITVFILFGVLLFFLVYRNFDLAALLVGLRQIRYMPFVVMFVLAFLSHYVRALRWRMLLNAEGANISVFNTLMAVFHAYFANLAFPRLGEVSRCVIVAETSRLPFAKSLGTVLTERLADMLTLACLLVAAIILQANVFTDFLHKNPDFGANVANLLSIKNIAIAVVVVAALLAVIIPVAKGRWNRYAVCAKLSGFLNGLWQGVLSLKNIRRRGLFVVQSLLIWTLYFVMLYVCFWAFDGFDDMGLSAALTIFVAGSLGMLAPAPNGIGAYHFMIIQTLLIYGFTADKAALFALVVHGMQTVQILIFGLASVICLAIRKKHYAKHNPTT